MELIDKETAVHCTDGELSVTGEENMLAVADYIQNVVQRLREAPAVELIWCKECKHSCEIFTGLVCTNGVVKYTEPDKFCAWAERSEE